MNGAPASRSSVCFADALRIRTVLGGYAQREPSIEDLPDDIISKLQSELPGILLTRDEVILAEPDVNYFSALAARFGEEADRSFFRLYGATLLDCVWPVYIEQQTDFSGCTFFGEGRLTTTYGKWLTFRRAYPNRYAGPANRRLEDIETSLLSTCACGDRESVIRELREFVRAFPDSPSHAAVLKRLRQLRAGHSPVRFRCTSG